MNLTERIQDTIEDKTQIDQKQANVLKILINEQIFGEIHY